jgi:phosphoglycolate phosphatase
MYLSALPIGPETRVLHVAPEPGLFKYLSERTKEKHYVTADFSPNRYAFAKQCRHIDFCNLDDWETESFDLILHSHVLEHTPCNIAYTMFHLDRMLKPSGRQVCAIPIMSGFWDERYSGLTGAEKVSRFAQNDHVRKFGRDDLRSSLGKIMRLPEKFDAELDFGRELLVAHNIPETEWRGFHGSTVLIFRKGDYLLSGDRRSACLPRKSGTISKPFDPQRYGNVSRAFVALGVLALLVIVASKLF